MRSENRSLPQGLNVWHRYGLPDHTPIGTRLPVLENTVTQIATGPYICGATIMSNGEVTAVHALVKPQSIGRMLFKPGFTGFYVPLCWAGDLKYNGVMATPTAIHMPVDDVYYHIRGGEREMLGCILPRTHFIETVAALRGVDPDQMALHEGALELAPEASSGVRKGLAAIVVGSRRGDFNCAPSDLTDAVFALMVDVYLHARPEPMPKSGRVRDPGRIVRAAEERFAEAGANPVSLADLCVAAKVSKSALYLAFGSWCGEPPLAYFHKRRLNRARSHLLNYEPGRGAIKHAALSVGLTELGRFSCEYRRLFGESPSVTLRTRSI